MDLTIIVVASFVFGLVIGSFLNVVIWRLPRQESLGGRSHCPNCDTRLSAVHLIPVISYLVQGKKCHHCRKSISFRYPLIEIITGLLFASAAIFLHPVLLAEYVALARLMFVLAVLVAVFVIDLEHYLILDVIIFPAVVVVLISNLILDLLHHQTILSLHSLTGGGVIAGAGFALFFYGLWAFSKGRWMGFGDVKLSLLLGLALGLPVAFVGFIGSFWLGAILGGILMVTGKKTMNSRLPFGTFLAVGSAIAMFYGMTLWDAYMRLIL